MIIIDCLDVRIRNNIKIGMYVEITEDKTNKVYIGYVLNILSKKDTEKGIRVELTSGIKGRVIEVFTLEKIKLENFKFYNKLLNTSQVFTVWDYLSKSSKIFDYTHHTTMQEFPTIIISDNKNLIINFLKENKLNLKTNNIVSLNPNKDIQSNLKIDLECMILINNSKYIRYDKFKEIENTINYKTKTIK